MALLAACCALGQESDFHAGALGDLAEFPAEVEVELPDVVLPFSPEVPPPDEAVPLLLAREELVPVVSGLPLSGFDADWPAPVPVPSGLLFCRALFWPRPVLVATSFVFPAPGSASLSPVG